jgi:hypothetical protein
MESWTLGNSYAIKSNPYELNVLDSSSEPIYDYLPYPGWNSIQSPISLSAPNGSSVKTTSGLQKDDPFSPNVTSFVEMTTEGWPGYDVSTGTQSNYYAHFLAKGSGTFTVSVDYDGSWSGITTEQNDYLLLGGSIQLRIGDIFKDQNEMLQCGNTQGGDYDGFRVILMRLSRNFHDTLRV